MAERLATRPGATQNVILQAPCTFDFRHFEDPCTFEYDAMEFREADAGSYVIIPYVRPHRVHVLWLGIRWHCWS